MYIYLHDTFTYYFPASRTCMSAGELNRIKSSRDRVSAHPSNIGGSIKIDQMINDIVQQKLSMKIENEPCSFINTYDK